MILRELVSVAIRMDSGSDMEERRGDIHRIWYRGAKM